MMLRTPLLTLAGLLLGGLAASHAIAADYGISFHYSSYAPACYSAPYYGWRYPQSYVYSYGYPGYTCPGICVGTAVPSMIIYDDCYPTVYRTTYTRSDCYARPVRHVGASIRYRTCGNSHRYYREIPSCRTRRATRWSSPRVFTSRTIGSQCHRGDSFGHLSRSFSGYRDRYRGSHSRSCRTPRIRVIRR
jgi:hypothetical protein